MKKLSLMFVVMTLFGLLLASCGGGSIETNTICWAPIKNMPASEIKPGEVNELLTGLKGEDTLTLAVNQGEASFLLNGNRQFSVADLGNPHSPDSAKGVPDGGYTWYSKSLKKDNRYGLKIWGDPYSNITLAFVPKTSDTSVSVYATAPCGL